MFAAWRAVPSGWEGEGYCLQHARCSLCTPPVACLDASAYLFSMRMHFGPPILPGLLHQTTCTAMALKPPPSPFPLATLPHARPRHSIPPTAMALHAPPTRAKLPQVFLCLLADYQPQEQLPRVVEEMGGVEAILIRFWRQFDVRACVCLCVCAYVCGRACVCAHACVCQRVWERGKVGRQSTYTGLWEWLLCGG